MMKEKTFEMNKTIELTKQSTYEKKNKKNTIPETLITTKAKLLIKEESLQKLEKVGARPKTKITGTRPCRTTRSGTHYTNVRHRSQIVTNRIKRRLCKGMPTKTKQQPNSEKTYRKSSERTK